MIDDIRFLTALTAGDATTASSMLDRAAALARSYVPEGAPEGLAAGRSALQLAIEHCGDDLALRILEAGANVEHRDRNRRGAIHDAFEYGARKTFERLLAGGAHVDAAIAAGHGDLARLDALLAEDPALANDPTTGLEPMGWAAYGDQSAAIRRLHDAGAPVGTAHLAMASSCGHDGAVRTLLELGAPPDGEGAFPLHETAAMRFSECTFACAEALLAAGADPARRDREGRRPHEIATDGLARAQPGSLAARELQRLLERLESETH